MSLEKEVTCDLSQETQGKRIAPRHDLYPRNLQRNLYIFVAFFREHFAAMVSDVPPKQTEGKIVTGPIILTTQISKNAFTVQKIDNRKYVTIVKFSSSHSSVKSKGEKIFSELSNSSIRVLTSNDIKPKNDLGF